MTLTEARPVQRRDLGGGTALAVAIGTMNVATYAYTMVAARRLGPGSYGAFAALMGLLLVVGVVQLGLQATGARRIAAQPAQVGEIERSVLAVGYRSALVLGLVCLVAAPLIDTALRLHSLGTAALVAAAAVPMTVMGAQAGVLQGERRWGGLALVYLANGVPRLAFGTALIWWHPTELAAMVGVVLGQCVPVVIGWLALRGSRPAGRTSGAHDGRAVLVEAAHSSHALLAFFALSNVDLLVARSALDARQAGLYAAGAIVVKAVLFLPQFVVVVAFPSMSSATRRRSVLLGSVAAVATAGLLCALGSRVLSPLALALVGGHGYAPVQGALWQFAVVGTLLSMLQLLVYGVLARGSRRSVFLIWTAVVLVAALGRLADGWSGLVALVIAVDAGLFAVLFGISLWRLRRTGTPLSAPPRASSGRCPPTRPAAR